MEKKKTQKGRNKETKPIADLSRKFEERRRKRLEEKQAAHKDGKGPAVKQGASPAAADGEKKADAGKEPGSDKVKEALPQVRSKKGSGFLDKVFSPIMAKVGSLKEKKKARLDNDIESLSAEIRQKKIESIRERAKEEEDKKAASGTDHGKAEKKPGMVESFLSLFKPEKKKGFTDDMDIRTIFKKEVKKQKKLSAAARKRRLSDNIEKAGFDFSVRSLHKWIFYASLAAVILITIFYVAYSIGMGQSVWGLYIQVLLIWTLGLGLVLGILWVVALAYLDMRMFHRKLEVEEVLPDFLQLTSANIRAGMTIDRALWSAVRPRFGILASEIEDVAKKTFSGEDLHTALLGFARRYDSAILLRSVNLLNEGIEAGGDIGDLLNKISQNIQELRSMKKEMAANVTTYVIFITFASVIAAPILFGLSHELLIIVQSIATDVASSGMDSSGGSGLGLTINISSDNVKISDYEIFAYTCILASSMFSAVIVGTIKKGSIKEDIHLLPIYMGVAVTMYMLSVWVMSTIFGGFF